MPSVVVVIVDSKGDERQEEYPDADGWHIEGGVLTVTLTNRDPVASYPAGRWVTVIRR